MATGCDARLRHGLGGVVFQRRQCGHRAGTRLILTDHTDYAQCVDGAREAKILQKIDHHVEGDIKDSGIPAVLRDNGRDMLFAKIDVQVPNPDQSDPDTPYVDDGLYFIYYGEGAQAVAEAIFGPSLRPGVTYSKEHLSRKQIVPRIMEILQ